MDKEKQLIFQVNSPSVLKGFEANNYHIDFNTNDDCDQYLCVIYFSSNEIYYPNTINAFNYSINERDKYEWKNNQFPNAHKHIFIRDIRKQWYMGGINSKLDSTVKVYEFLKEESKGYRVHTVGSSAGGFAAILFGSLLNAIRVYAFNAQLNLKVNMQTSSPKVDPILFQKADIEEYKRYFDLSNFINNKVDYFYFQSCHSKMDLEQYDALSRQAKQSLKIIRFKTANHGFPFLRINLPHVLKFNEKDLNLLVNKTFHPIAFSIDLIGVTATLKFMIKALVNRYKKKKLESVHNKLGN